MLLNCRELTRYEVLAQDGAFGTVRDIVVHLPTWLVHAVIIDADGLLTHREVSVAPDEIGTLEFPSETLRLRKTTAEMEAEIVAAGAASGLGDHDAGANELMDFTIEASDGPAGVLKGMLVDTALWRIRYVVIDRDGWSADRLTLLKPDAIERVDREHRRIHVAVTRKQVLSSPAYTADVELSRDWEAFLYDHYGWPQGD